MSITIDAINLLLWKVKNIKIRLYFVDLLLFRVENKICDTKLCNMWKRKCKIRKKKQIIVIKRMYKA